RGRHRVEQVARQLQLLAIELAQVVELRYLGDALYLFRVSKFIQDQAAVLGRNDHDVFPVAQDHLSDPYFAAFLQRLTQQSVSFRRGFAIRTGIIGRFVQGSVNLGGVDESLDFDDTRALEPQLLQVLRFDD